MAGEHDFAPLSEAEIDDLCAEWRHTDGRGAVRLTFFVACVPPKTSHHAKRIVRVGAFSRLADTPELKAASALLEALFIEHRPPAALSGPLMLTIDLTWPWLTADSKKVRALGRVPHPAKPDADNAAKGITDVLARLRFLEHDSTIVDLHVRKWRGDEPGIGITLQPWSDEEAA